MLFREFDDALGLTQMASWALRDNRTGGNARHDLLACFASQCLGASTDMKTSMTPVVLLVILSCA